MLKKRVAIFTHDASLSGGGSISLLSLLQELASSPHFSLLVIVPKEGEFVNAVAKHNIPCKVISYPWNTTLGKHPKNLQGSLLKRLRGYRHMIRKLGVTIDEFKPDVIYTNTSVIYWGSILAILRGKPHVWHIRELKGQYGIKHDFGIWFFKVLLKKSKAVIVNSGAVQKDYELTNWKHCKIVYNGIVSDKELEAREQQLQHRGTSTRTFAIIAAIDPTKGQLEAVKAFAYWLKQRDNRNFRLLLIGSVVDNEYYKSIKGFIVQEGLQNNICYEGFEPDMNNRYKQIDALICPSMQEAFGRVIIEAMLHKALVIARNTGGIPEIIDDGINGFLFNNEQELISCLDKSQENVHEILENGFKKIARSFTIEKYAGAIEGILLNVVQ